MEENIYHINILFADRFGDYHENEVGGFYSRVLQHEIDHLFGRLFVNKIVYSSTDNCDIGHLLLYCNILYLEVSSVINWCQNIPGKLCWSA